MPFKKAPQVFSAKINEVTIGTGDNAITIGGENVLPFYSFDAEISNSPKIGVEISDLGPNRNLPDLAKFYEGADSIADIAKRAAAMPGGDFVVLHLEGSDPNGEDKSVEDCVELCKQVADAIDKPLAVMGSGNQDKDGKLLEKAAEALQGKNVLIMSAHEENYKGIAVGAGVAYGQKVSAESAVDINLAKQLNVLITQMGVKNEGIVMNLGSAAAGYGYEYLASTMDRVKGAALTQNDAMLQMPIIAPISTEAWSVKEAIVSEADFPEWGPQEQRGIDMEITTASASLVCGANAVIMRHPDAVAAVSKLIAELV